jgi:hypothetical protein
MNGHPHHARTPKLNPDLSKAYNFDNSMNIFPKIKRCDSLGTIAPGRELSAAGLPAVALDAHCESP